MWNSYSVPPPTSESKLRLNVHSKLPEGAIVRVNDCPSFMWPGDGHAGSTVDSWEMIDE